MLKHPLAECDTCPLKDERYVPSAIPDGARLVVVGEAPGYQEAIRGRPFTGPSGQLLDRVLQHYGYPRKAVAYTNVVACRPPGNATPPRSAVNACRKRLISDIAQAGARDVLALGGPAASALVPDTRTITHLRVGPPKRPHPDFFGTAVERVIPSWHPAYCLRVPDAFPTLVSDVGKLNQETSNVWREPDWRYFDDPADARLVIAELRTRTRRLVVDIEVGIEKDFSFAHPNDYDLLCVGLAYERNKAVVLGTDALRDRAVLDDLRELLAEKELIGHNGKFDLEGLFPLLGALELWADTMLASYCLDERPGQHGLKVLAVEKLGAPRYDDEILKYIPKGGNYANIPRPILYKYNALDVHATWLLWHDHFEPQLEAEDMRKVHDFLIAASNQLMFLELNGITIDREYNRELTTGYLQTLADMEVELNAYVSQATDGRIKTLNPRSPAQILRFLDDCGITVASTNEATLTALLPRLEAGPLAYFVSGLLQHRSEQKLYGTYVKGIRKRTYRGRVHTTYMLHGTTSGRLASRNPNLQNIARNKAIRRQFSVSKPDHVLIQADYKQAEGRIIATMAQDEYLQHVFNDPAIDLFDDLSDQLYGPGNWTKEERVRTKAFFYGLSYGRQAFSIAMEYKMPVSMAEKRLKEFMNLIPATAAWQKDVCQRVLDGEDLVTPFGRRRRFWLITNENRKDVLNEALSFLPQSTASDICLGALVRLRPMLRGLGWIRLTIHDALVVECPRANVETVSGMLRDTMVSEAAKYTDYVPFPVDLSVGTTWGDL